MPPTAGVRALSLDGGGVKGIIPLVVLQSLEKELMFLDVPLHEHFDFVAGTSAGGLIAIGLFLMGWSTTECISKFEAIATKTFASSDTVSTLRRMRQFLVAFLRDWKHSSSAIEDAFKSDADVEVKMFNPLVSDTKVAVTSNTTTALNPEPCIFSNYNHSANAVADSGSSLEFLVEAFAHRKVAYTVIRATDPARDVSLAQAYVFGFQSYQNSWLTYSQGNMHFCSPTVSFGRHSMFQY
jgi:hypothetical protein